MRTCCEARHQLGVADGRRVRNAGDESGQSTSGNPFEHGYERRDIFCFQRSAHSPRIHRIKPVSILHLVVVSILCRTHLLDRIDCSEAATNGEGPVLHRFRDSGQTVQRVRGTRQITQLLVPRECP